MNFRLAVMQDLPRLKAMYEDIIQNMNNNQIQIRCYRMGGMRDSGLHFVKQSQKKGTGIS